MDDSNDWNKYIMSLGHIIMQESKGRAQRCKGYIKGIQERAWNGF
jgi:hypothetical protein